MVHTRPTKGAVRSCESHQRSWWIVHIRLVRRRAGKMAVVVRLSMNNPATARLCKKFVVRPSGGSLYLGFRLITNFRLKAELRTSFFYTVSALVEFGRGQRVQLCRLA